MSPTAARNESATSEFAGPCLAARGASSAQLQADSRLTSPKNNGTFGAVDYALTCAAACSTSSPGRET
jgi:hypothetical protein